MRKKQILVIEDDEAIRQGIVDALEFDGYTTLEASQGNIGLKMALEKEYDLILLDLVLPEMGGFEILQKVREVFATVPVIILTAKGEENDRVRGLRMGSDDYVVKPFSVKELLARVDAVLRRSPERPSKISKIDIPGGFVDIKRCEVIFDKGGSKQLSEYERELFCYLASNLGRAISREELLARIWHIDAATVETRTIDMHIARLREKLGNKSVIVTVRGKGYMFAKKS